MSIKYCYNHEIHKTLHIPPDYPSLLTDISSLFVQKLPLTFYLQYQDSDGDKIAIANDQEFQALVKQELTDPTSCIKLFITDLNNAPHPPHQRSTCTPRSNSNGSFEVVESENSLRMEEITDTVLPNNSEGEEEEEDDLESKVVVSLQIPQTNTILKNDTKFPEDNEQEEPSFSCSATGKSRTSESRDLVQEMSLSMVEEGSVADGESCASNPAFNQAFQTEEENLSLSEEEESMPRENPKKNMNIKEVVQGNMRTVTLEIPDFREKDSRDLSEYLSRIIKRKSGEQASVKLDKILCSGTSEAPEEEDDENNIDKSKEESPERWVSFDSQHDETPPTVELPQQRRNLFTLKQRPETWFMCNQDRSNRYREEQEGEGEGELSDSMAAARRSPNKMMKRYEQEFVDRVMMNDKILMKDDEAGMYYQELKTKKVKSEQPSAEISFKENPDDLLHDIWYDLQHSIKIQSDKAQQFSFEDYYERKSQGQGDEQESPREVVETMNMSLLTASEAKRIASAIGSINRIEGVKKLRIFPEPNSPVEKANNKKAPSPLYNRWACRRSDIKLPGEEDWPFLGQCETAGKKEVCNFTENKVHEGSFCMGCWQSPIRGPRYVCLICDDIEYCEACETKINHCHPLLKVKEPVGSLQDFMENMRTKLVQKSEPVFTPRGELSFKEESVYKDMDTMEKAECEEDDEYRNKEEMRDEYKFDFKEISSTPLMIKSNQKEWCVVYKTICLKNTGTSMWRRCHFEPVGLVPGTITEVSYVSPGDSVLVTLEIHGFFAPGKYNSTWRVVHQGDLNVLSEMGYIDLEFDVVENRSNLFGGHLQQYQFCDY